MILFIVAGILTTEAKILTLRNFCEEVATRGMLIRKGKLGKSC